MGVGACSYRQQQRRGQPAWPPLSRGPRRDAQQRCRRSSRARRLGATPPAPVSCTHTQAQAHTQVSQQRGTRVGRGHRSLARAHTLVRGSAARRLKNPRHGGETNRGRLGQRACARTRERGVCLRNRRRRWSGTCCRSLCGHAEVRQRQRRSDPCGREKCTEGRHGEDQDGQQPLGPTLRVLLLTDSV